MANSKTLTWQHDGKNTDGSVIAAGDFLGWELAVDSQPSLSVPRGWETDGSYTIELSELFAGKAGTFQLALALVTKQGKSDFTGSLPAVIDFRKPNSPFAFAVS
jgi:hypothetical protein